MRSVVLIDRMIGRPKVMYLAQLLSQDQPRSSAGRDPEVEHLLHAVSMVRLQLHPRDEM